MHRLSERAQKVTTDTSACELNTPAKPLPMNTRMPHWAQQPKPGAWLRGTLCAFTFLISPLGKFVPRRFANHTSADRLEHGLVIILPGIDSFSFLNLGTACGLLDGGVRSAIRTIDWTTGWDFLFLYHLRGDRRNWKVAQFIADEIRNYQSRYPGRPVTLVGHSGGGGMALRILELLGPQSRISAAVLIAPAVSTQYDLTRARQGALHGIWHFYSPLDLFFVGAGTILLGTFDGKHSPCSGMLGFQHPSANQGDGAPFHQVAYDWSFTRWFHTGGHLSCVNRVFVEAMIAPLIKRFEQAV
ncbi:Alpha/beta hydrolase family protein [Planctopirus ephydatiae]|uniref:Alpha/beta hydrolase family protein n=1 Tax=Planctopirus ephydatiae TaxID=2528019 RepID=A0A518GRV1_9PLAN|nr:alpha/beta fold hydrolase [Planctopirus ephydatiae]QDV31309.1 Alpha/beta hydrolase family protein [Planctopirus ephydatiae]